MKYCYCKIGYKELKPNFIYEYRKRKDLERFEKKVNIEFILFTGDDKNKHQFCKEKYVDIKEKYGDFSFNVTVHYADEYFNTEPMFRNEKIDKIIE